MGAVTLPSQAVDNEKRLQELIITKSQRLTSSIRLDAKDLYVSDYVLTLNPEKMVNQAQKLETQTKILNLHGIAVAGSKSILREYVVGVFQTKAIFIYQSQESAQLVSNSNKKYKRSFKKISSQDNSKEVRRVRNLSIRAIYALGLDYGIVKCGIGIGRRTLVIQVYPTPKVNLIMAQEFGKAIAQYANQTQIDHQLNEVVLGADPEFVMQSPKGHLLIASKYFPLKGKVGCDAIWMGQNHANKPIVEVRPDPTSDPHTLVVNIYKGLLFAARKMKNVPSKWLTGAMPYKGFPLGGHIHFSGIQPDFKLLRALDNYLTLPLVNIEDDRGKARRPKYGFLGDFRYQPHGGFEYRTPPSWLISPMLCKGVFMAAQVIVANYKQLQYQPLEHLEMQQAYYRGDKDEIKEIIQYLWEDLKELDDYRVYKKTLDLFYSYLISGMSWDERTDFRKQWRIPPFQDKD
ncbi:hypothetical protein IC619_010905 [Hazenella sp. IB182353]|uniref:putative amidoligase domain-containing protein n=1 Tax=Polycladospora coralii TaxID=2771432 RepID=UPI001746106F|nr:hypothetical protein [Polycladospora coralii]MBS7531001.1 hypothetical protein [Polycladospora coralii]